jgi:hypothetical protein
MHHIIYMSQASKPLSPEELVRLLIQARSVNEQHYITGALVYGDNHFLQVIEGEEKAVTTLYQRIARDYRHQQVVKLADNPIQQRRFAQWAMAFDDVSADQFKELIGCILPVQVAEQIPPDGELDQVLLAKMKEIVCA